MILKSASHKDRMIYEAFGGSPRYAYARNKQQMKYGRFELIACTTIALGGFLRFLRIDVPGLWIDEGYTIMFARMTWPQVLGLHGAYDSHPPLYFATAKLFGLIFPELIAGRLVSVVAGALTLPVLYALARQLTNRWIALAALAALAFSPLHVWYSRDARMYAPAMLFVTLSYLAVVSFHRQPSRRWAILYGLSVLLAMYYSYSSFYALVPQIAILYILARRQGRESTPIILALALAVVAYLPWVPQWLSAIQEADPLRVTYLGVSTYALSQHLVGLAGLADRGYYQGVDLLPWETFPALNWLFAVAMLVCLAVAVMSLARVSTFALITALSLSAGTVLVAMVSSLFSPGFASRTLIAALLGWVMLLGAATFRGNLSQWRHRVGIAGYIVAMIASIASLFAIYTASERQRWQDMALDLAVVAPLRQPVLIVRPVDYVLIDVYQPHILDTVMVTTTTGLKSDTVWFAYHDSPKFEEYHAQLRALGYERVQHKYYYTPLYLDEYVRKQK